MHISHNDKVLKFNVVHQCLFKRNHNYGQPLNYFSNALLVLSRKEIFLTLFILLPPKISPLSTLVQPHEVRKLLVRDVLKEQQDQVLRFSVSHVIHRYAELGHEDVVLDGCSAEKQKCFEVLFNIVVKGVSQIQQYVCNNDLQSSIQSAYRPFHSCETAVLRVINCYGAENDTIK